jgi:polyisoprenoid-binding protein YceI
MTKATLAAAVLAVLTTAPALAQTAPQPAPIKVESGAYAVDPYHTQITFGVDHLGFTTFRGRFNQASGSLQLDGANPATSKFDISVPTDSVDTPVGKLSDELKGEQWLGAKAFPQITFKATSVTVTGPRDAKVTGDFTLHGVTRPLTLTARLHGAGINPLDKKFTVGFELSGRIKRSDFGIKTFLPVLGDTVDLTISAAFEKQG